MDEDRKAFVERVRIALDRRGWSQRRLADEAILGEATIFRLMKGEYSTKTRRKIEAVLGLDASGEKGKGGSRLASVQNGGYSRELYSYYEGDYLCVRPAFSSSHKFIVYQMNIHWSEEGQGLEFEDNNPGHQQSGMIMLPMGTQYLHFITRDRGSARLITAYHMPQNSSSIKGLMLTFANPKGHEIFPATVPIVMQRIPEQDVEWRGLTGLIDQEDSRVMRFKKDFEEIGITPVIMHA